MALFMTLVLTSHGASYSNSLSAGFNLIANQLDGTNNLLNTVLPFAHDNDQLFTWNEAAQDFNPPDTFVAAAGSWFDGNFDPSSTTLAPGQGAFYASVQANSFSVVGTQRTPSLPILQTRNVYRLVSRQIPGPGTYENIVGLPPENGSKFIRFNRGTQDFETNVFNGIVWSGGAPAAAVGEAVFIFLPPAPPIITQQPTSKNVVENQSATFSVAAVGEVPLHFQWRRNGVAVTNANASSYTIPFTAIADSGDFSVVITNASGSATSTIVTLTVTADSARPTLLSVKSAANFSELNLRFSERVDASANDDFNYTLAGFTILTAVLGPDSSNVTLTVSPPMTEGNTYSLSVQDIADLAMLPNLLNPNPTQINFQAANPPIITNQPQERAVFPGSTATFSVAASGTNPKGYQWLKNNIPLPGQTGSGLTISNVQPQNLGGYSCVVSNAAGTVASQTATLSFLQLIPVDLPAGYSFVSKPLANSSPQFPIPPDGTVLWKWNPVLQTFDTFSYIGGLGWDPAEPILAVGEGVVIQLPSPATLNFVGSPVTPMLPVTLQPGLNLLGAQSPKIAGYPEVVGPPQEGSVMHRYKPGGDPTKLTFENYQISYFRHGMWNDSPPPLLNVAESAYFSLVTPVAITMQPVGYTNVTPGQAVTFAVTASGTGPLQYQWRLNGTSIPGATNASYPIQSVNASNAGLYSVSVGNAVGHINSLNAPLTINAPSFNMTDDFAAQGSVNDFSRLLSSQNRNATIQTNEPAHAGKRARGSVWLTWTAPADGIVTMSTAGSGFDTLLAAYRGTNLASLILMDASDDEAGYACSRISFNAQQGVPYRICVAALGTGRGNILLGWNLEVTTQVLPEIRVQPEDLTVGYGDTAQFTVTATNGSFSYQWYHDGVLIAGASQPTLTINNVGDADLGSYYVHVYNAQRSRDSLSAALQIEVPEPGQPLTGGRATAKFFDLLLPGGGSGTPLKGTPQKLGGTVAHGYSGAQTFNSTGMGKDPDEPNHCGIVGGNSVWYAIQATNHGTMYIDTDGSSFNTVLAAYVGPGVDFLTLTNVACDNNSGLDGADSRTSFAATAGTIYYIAVDGVGNASGTVKFHYHLVRPLVLTNLVYSAAASGSFTMKINTTPSLTNLVQYRTNLTSTNWVSVLTNTSAAGTFNYTNTGIGALTNRYYRALNKF